MKLRSQLRLIFSVFMLFGLTLWWGCQKVDDPQTQTPDHHLHSAQLPKEWMDMVYNTVKRQGLFALDASRLYAYSAITMYESMVHGLPNGRSLAGQLHDLDALPQPEAGKTYDYGIVLCHTMPQVIRGIMPNLSVESNTRIDGLEEQQEAQMRSELGLSEQVIEDSKNYADALAAAIIEWSKSDNREGMEALIYTPPSDQNNPQYWKGSTLGQTFMMPFWWTSRPFVISSYRQCEPEPPYAYSEDPNSAYYRDVKEVYDASFDPAKVAIGQYWANNPGLSGSPAGSWIGIANQLVDQYQMDLPTTLRMYVLLAIGTRDAFIACWYAKYKFYLERPVTYIRDVMGHTTWSSPVPTPPYPDYTSGTSVNAGCSSEMLTRLLGHREFADAQHSDKGFGTRNFTSFKDAGIEAFHSRIYGGVHMRRACEKGFEQGECLADYIWTNLQFEQ